MFGGNVMLMPGQELRSFDVRRPKARETEMGRVLSAGRNEEELLGQIRAILAAAKPEEIERWRQLEHPVTHKIIMKHKPPFAVRPGDIFEKSGRRFYVQTHPYDPGGIGHWTIFYCDERSDVSHAAHQ